MEEGNDFDEFAEENEFDEPAEFINVPNTVQQERPVKRRRGLGRRWIECQEFESADDALVFLKKEVSS